MRLARFEGLGFKVGGTLENLHRTMTPTPANLLLLKSLVCSVRASLRAFTASSPRTRPPPAWFRTYSDGLGPGSECQTLFVSYKILYITSFRIMWHSEDVYNLREYAFNEIAAMEWCLRKLLVRSLVIQGLHS